MTVTMTRARRYTVYWAGLLLAASAAKAIANDAFLNEIEDLPLAQGLAETSGGLLFDTVDGRIVEAIASGTTDARGVRSFYAETLPQLGWQRLSELTFRREGEVLRIVIEDRRQPIVVRFSLAPQGATP